MGLVDGSPVLRVGRMSTGYTNCQACDAPSMDALCQWCRLGAYANDHNPDEIESIDFNGHLLAVWRESGEVIADHQNAVTEWAKSLQSPPTAIQVAGMLT